MATAYERESILNYNEEDNKWECYIASPKIHTKIKKILEEGQVPKKIYKDEEGKECAWVYDLDYKQIGFRTKAKKREITDEQRQVLVERMNTMRENKNNNK